jgi:hypothetical protein
MFDELKKFKTKGHFFFQATDAVEEACNIPSSGQGVCIIYQLKHGRLELVYIGGSGSPQKLEYRSLRDFIINGQSASTARSKSWAVKMLSENVDALDIYWWITDDKKPKDDPLLVELDLLELYIDVNDELPRWNKTPSKKRK